MTLTVTSRQNATSTPGDSARLTSVELSENATTIPTTASTPSAFGVSARSQVGRGTGVSARTAGMRVSRPTLPSTPNPACAVADRRALAERDLGLDARARPGRAVDRQPAVERLHPRG